LLVLGALACGRTALAQCPDGTPPPCAGARQVAIAAPSQLSVAVLYFDNLSRDTGDAYLADGLTEDIITRLGQVPRLVVKSRTAVQRFRGRAAEEPSVLGRRLGVAHLVSGSVRRAGRRLRVNVELVRTAGGVRVWGDVFDRSSDDLLAIEEDIARAIATAVAGRLAPAELATLATRPTRDAAAHDQYLRGNWFLARRTPADVRLALEQFESAARLDPGFTGALARIGYAYALFLDWGWSFPGLSRDSLLARGFAVADRALALDSSSAEAWMTRGYLLSSRHPRTLEGVDAAFERAIALDPHNAEAHHQYGYVLMLLGDDAGGQELERALALEPERPVTLVTLAYQRWLARRHEEARALLDSALVLDPGASYAYARRVLWGRATGDVEGAQADANAASRLSPAGYPHEAEGAMAVAEWRRGARAVARERLQRLNGWLLALPESPGIAAYVAVVASVELGDWDGALRILERLTRGALLWTFTRDPLLDPLRVEPRFRRLVEESRPPGPRGSRTP
jgi:TolB-like protein/Tfp pilus assembly protein PilF